MTPIERGDAIRASIAAQGAIVWDGINLGKVGAQETEGMERFTKIEDYALFVIGLRIGRAAKRGEI